MMMEFSTEELRLLLDDGYEPAYMRDIAEGDLVAIPPASRVPIYGDERDGDRHHVRTRRVVRIGSRAGDVVSFIGADLDGLPRHETFGGSYPCCIKRGMSTQETQDDLDN